MQPMQHSPFRSHLLGTISAVLLAASACGGGDGDVEPACEDGAVRDCYSGPEGTLGVGVCTGGEQTCVDGVWSACNGERAPSNEVCDDVDNNCDGRVDEDLKNACGGCAALEGTPGSPCGTCGTWECAGPEAVSCLPPSPALGAACTADNGCVGEMECGADNVARCITLQRTNECGVCNGPRVDGLGEACEAGGCTGEYVCNAAGDAAVCGTTGPNECGVCNGPAVEGIGEACEVDTCAGQWVCDPTGTDRLCDAPAPNDCGLCGGPAITGRGSPCTVGACAGFMECNAAGDSVVCSSSGLNNCWQCDAEDVPGVDEACIAANGCEGVGICDAGALDGVECVATSTPNACGLCGGPPIADVGVACTHPDGCTGEMACNEDGNATECNAPPRNACGGCTVLEGVAGDPCDTDDGCGGTLACDDGDLVCIPEATRNACGACGDPVPDIDGHCVAADGCNGQWQCTEDGLDRRCVALQAANECGLCGGPDIPGFGLGCFTASGCPSVVGCNDDRDAAACVEVAPAECNRTDHVVFSEIATEGPNPICPDPGEPCPEPQAGARNEFVELYNPTDGEVDLAGYMIWRRVNAMTGGGIQPFTLVFQFPEDNTFTKVPSRRFLLWGGYRYPNAAVFKAATNNDYLPSGYMGGQLWLIRKPDVGDLNPISSANPPPANLSPDDPRVVDMVGWGDGAVPLVGGVPAIDYAWHEGSGPAPFPAHPPEGKTGSIERKAFADSTTESLGASGHDRLLGNGWDSNDSEADWVQRPVRQPQNRTANLEPPTLPSH